MQKFEIQCLSPVFCLNQRFPNFLGTGRSDFERAAQSAPARTRNRFLTRFDAKNAGNLSEDERNIRKLIWFLAKFLC